MLRSFVLLVLSACCTLAMAQTPPRQVFIAGDSTASGYGPERAPREGWGQRLQDFLDAEAYVVRNHAQSGRSARSFIAEGRLDAMAKDMRAGDVLLVQFGHNDAKREDPSRYNEPQAAFPHWLGRYLALAREKGATPILVTPVARREFRDGEPVDTHGAYAQAVRELAGREDVGLIDLAASSMDWLRAAGNQASRAYFMHVPGQKEDDTHFQARGAVMVACLVVAGWKTLDPALAPHVVRDTDCGAPPTALADRKAQAHPSQVAHERDLAVRQPGPHGGAGATTAYPFFRDAPALGFEFRKRVLHKGAGIGLHQHHKDEIYYVLGGRGIYELDGSEHPVQVGDAMLTRPGSTHAIRQDGDEDLVLLIMYGREPP